MQIAVAGATGNIGTLTVAALERDGHDVRPISRSLGVDLSTGDGLDGALAGVEAVVDVTNSPAASVAETVAYFSTATKNLLAAEQRAGVRAPCAALDRRDRPHRGQRALRRQAGAGAPGGCGTGDVDNRPGHAVLRLRCDGGRWSEQSGVATIAPLLVQPIAPADVADILAEIAVGAPQGRYVDVAGPEPQDLVDMARRTAQARGRAVRLVPTWAAIFGPEMAGNVLLPGEGARIAPTTFDDWLKAQR